MTDVVAAGAQPLPDHRQAPFLHAGFWRRFAAYIIDGFIIGAVTGVLYVVLVLAVALPAAASGTSMGDATTIRLAVLFWVIVIVGQWLYFALCESSKWQATPGKLALGLRVTDLFGRRIGFGKATGRFFGKILSGAILDIGYMMAGWTERKQALHDILANCCVVRGEALAAFERGEAGADGAAVRTGAAMPGWVIALIVVGALSFMIAPVAIMAAIAIPAYQNYLIRAQVAEGMALADGAKVAVAEYAANNEMLPVGNTAAGLPAPGSITGRYVSAVTVDQGNVVVTFDSAANPRIAGRHLELEPSGTPAHIAWQCGSPDIDARYLPAACRH